jgi:hypothetical protein
MFVSIVTMLLLPGSSFTAQACPPEESSLPLANNLSQRNTFTDSTDGTSGDSKRQSLLDAWEIAGFGAVAGLFAIALLCKVRYARAVAPGEADLLSRYPHLEHPEMALAIVPREALSSTFDPDMLVVR